MKRPPNPPPGNAKGPPQRDGPQREVDSERGDLLGDRRLAVRRLVLVDDALAHGLVELATRLPQSLGRGVLVAARRGLFPSGSKLHIHDAADLGQSILSDLTRLGDAPL